MKIKTLTLSLIASLNILVAQEINLGLMLNTPESFEGYTLFSSLADTNIYLIDNCGRKVHEWNTNYLPGNSYYFSDDGSLWRCARNRGKLPTRIGGGGQGQYVQQLDWDGNILWQFEYLNDTIQMHHDIDVMPNGNILILAWDLHSYEDCIQSGRDSALLRDSVIWSEHIIEVNPTTNEIVWEWWFWDHLAQDYDSSKDNYAQIKEHPELLDINYLGWVTTGEADWIHANSLDYNPELDQVVLNSRNLNEFYVIDHSTTTEEARGSTGGNSGMGGDIIYRWGNAEAYLKDSTANKTLFGAHDVHWIDKGLPNAGQILVFNNGNFRPDGAYSSVVRLSAPYDQATGKYTLVPGKSYEPLAPNWIYTAPDREDFASFYISGAQQLPNGNVLVCNGAIGELFELDQNDEVVWQYINPVSLFRGVLYQGDSLLPFAFGTANAVFRATRYATDHPAFTNVSLSAGEPLELEYPLPYSCEGYNSLQNRRGADQYVLYPNPADQFFYTDYPGEILLFSSHGINVGKLDGSNNQRFDCSLLASGVYYLRAENGDMLSKLMITR